MTGQEENRTETVHQLVKLRGKQEESRERGNKSRVIALAVINREARKIDALFHYLFAGCAGRRFRLHHRRAHFTKHKGQRAA